LKKIKYKPLNSFIKEEKKENKGKIKLIEEPVQLKVYIPKSLSRELRKLISMKYPEYKKGNLSVEVTHALIHWVSLHKNANNTNYEKVCINPPNSVTMVAVKVRQELAKKYGFTPRQALTNELRQAIARVRGKDPRTVRKWMRLLERYDFIKHLTGDVWEIN